MKQTILILRGPSGVGKSTIAQAVQQKLGLSWAIIDVDKFKHYMPIKDGTVKGDPARVKRANVAHDVANYFAKKMYQNDYSVIMEEMYRQHHFEQLTDFLKEADMDYLSIFLHAPLELVLERAQGREKVAPIEETKQFYAECQPTEGDIFIDTSKLSLEEIVTTIIDSVQNLE